MDKTCKKWPKLLIFTFLPTLPPGNGPLMAIESWNIYKMPFKSDNPSLDMILSKKNTTYWQKMAKMTNFHYFWPTLPPGNGPFMAIESWKMYKMPLKSDNPSLDMILPKKTTTYWQKMQKMAKITNFHCFWPTLPPENKSLMVTESQKIKTM